jgi:hypothetical protein
MTRAMGLQMPLPLRAARIGAAGRVRGGDRHARGPEHRP